MVTDALYLVSALVTAVVLARQADHKPLMVVVLVWLLGYPILARQEYIPSLGPLGFDLQPNRALLIVLFPAVTALAIHGAFSRRHLAGVSVPRRRVAAFEWFLVLYLLASMASIILAEGEIETKTVAAVVTGQLLFGAAYYTARQFVTERDLMVLSQAILVLAAFSALVGLVQFFVAPDFFTGEVGRIAFGGLYRASGVFEAEYYQGMFQVIALLVAFASGLPTASSLALGVLFSVAVFLTMHRLSWIVLGVVATLWLLMHSPRRHQMLILYLLALGCTVLIAGLSVWDWQTVLPANLVDTFVSDRVTQDTLSGREVQYAVALDIITKYPLGLGDYSSLVYVQEIYQHGAMGMLLLGGGTLPVHNGFLAAGVKYGIAGMVGWSGFLVMAMLYFGRRFFRQGGRSPLPLLLFLSLALYNSTNDFSYLGQQVLVVYALMLGALIARPARAAQRARVSGQIPKEGSLDLVAPAASPHFSYQWKDRPNARDYAERW